MNSQTILGRLAFASVSATFALALAGCTATGSAGWTYAPLGPTPSASAAASGSPSTSASPGTSGSPVASGTPGASSSPGGTTLELEETNALQILQNGAPVSELHVTAGQSYTFRINNTAGFTHDFYLGPADRLSAGDTDGLPGVPINESGVQEFTWTASADATGWQFACTVEGHYELMHGALVLDGN